MPMVIFRWLQLTLFYCLNKISKLWNSDHFMMPDVIAVAICVSHSSQPFWDAMVPCDTYSRSNSCPCLTLPVKLFILFLAPSWQPNRSQGCHAVGGTGLWGHSCSPPTAESNAWAIQPVVIFHIRGVRGIIFMLHCLPLWIITVLFQICLYHSIPPLRSTVVPVMNNVDVCIKRYTRLSEICLRGRSYTYFNHLWNVDIFIQIVHFNKRDGITNIFIVRQTTKQTFHQTHH